MFNNIKKGIEKATGKKVDLRSKFQKLQDEIILLHSLNKPSPTVRQEITAAREAVDNQIKKFNSDYDIEVNALKAKYNKLQEDAILDGMRAEIKIRKTSNNDQFTIPLQKK